MGHNTNTRSRRPNPLLLIGIGLVAVILIAVIFIVSTKKESVDSGDNDSNQSSTQPYGDYKKEFNSFANYITSGKESENQLEGEYESSKNYALRIALKDKDETKKLAFVNEADKLFEFFYHDFLIDGPEESSVIAIRVKNYQDSWSFLKTYLNTDWNTEDDILKLYNNLGETSAEAEIDTKYSALVESESSTMRGYVELRKSYEKLVLKRIDRYSRNDCVSNGAINDECVSTLRHDTTDTEITRIRSEMNRVYSSEVLTIIGGSWDISALVNDLEASK